MSLDKFIIRPATKNDTGAIVALVKSALEEFGLIYSPGSSESDLQNIEITYGNGGGQFLVMQDRDAKIIATVAILRMDKDNCKLRKMYVASNYRGRKLGEQLLTTALVHAKQLGFTKMFLETVHTMHAAIALYKKFGFQTLHGTVADSPRCDTVMFKAI